MKILFVARHAGGPTSQFAAGADNDDEGAVSWALEQFGHEVIRVQENPRRRTGVDLADINAQLCLFFKWPTAADELPRLRMPAVGWYFDMARSVEGDPTLAPRDAVRVQWLRSVVPLCLAFFMSDGDYVMRDTSGKLVHLMQGSDERVIGPGVAPVPDTRPPLLFAGMVNHGRRRASHIAELKARYGNRLEVLGDGGPARRKHGRELADTMAGRIVIAPDGPQTDAYMSNRLVQACGFGAFVVHPYCAVAAAMYGPGEGVVYYGDRAECDALIDQYLGPLADRREAIARAGYKRTLRDNLYRHRAAELIAEVGRRLSCRT